MMKTKRLLALDVEGTIITGYDYSRTNPDDTFPAIIHPELAGVLERFKANNFTIVTATGTDADNLQYYQSEIKKNGFDDDLIDAFSPDKHDPNDSKENKLTKYATQFNINMENVYFYDDGPGNVERAQQAGCNAYRVTEDQPLCVQLQTLARKLNLTSESTKMTSHYDRTSTATAQSSTVSTKEDFQMKITNAITGEVIDVNLCEDDTVSSVKQKLFAMTGTAVDYQSLIHEGIEMPDDRKLKQSDFNKKSTVLFVVRRTSNVNTFYQPARHLQKLSVIWKH